MGTVRKTSNTISEKPMYIRFGWLVFKIKPATLLQIYEAGSELEETNSLDLKGKINPVEVLLKSYKDIDIASKIVVILMFRSLLCRLLFGRFVRHRLDMYKYQKIMDYSVLSFNATFFLTNFTFLKGVREVTKPTNTPEATARGDSSEE